MKKRFFVAAMLFLAAIYLHGQTISSCEYWFDDNYAARQSPPLSINGSNATFDGTFSTEGLSMGGHILNYRCRDAAGRYSGIVSQFFIKRPPTAPRQIVAYEYWFDNDDASPTARHYTAIANPTADYTFDLVDGLNSANLPIGGHLLNIRFKDNQGDWSGVASQFFIKRPPTAPRQIVAYEYWFDNDDASPTARHYTPIANPTADYTFDLVDGLNSANLPIGGHLLNVRFKDNQGDWSGVTSQFFIKRPPTAPRQIVAYEYWFDNDDASPTARHYTAIANPTADYTFDLADGLNTANLSIGGHLLNVRFKDNQGDWSGVTSQFFIKTNVSNTEPKIVAYQYWFNNDTDGLQTVNLSVPVTNFTAPIDINVPLASGLHKLYVRFKDSHGKWSGIIEQPFNKYEPGVTVIVHGFSLTGSFPDWTLEMAKAIQGRIGDGNSAVIYKNDPATSQWVLYRGDPTDPNREIILVYDWANLSNNGIASVEAFGGNGYLESAADNLFAMLLSVPMNLGGNMAILNRPKHFIGHSRGTIVLLQLLHRLKKFFPNVNVEQVTFLDPHPASPFGDIEGNYPFNVKNLPCVKGRATGFLGLCNLFCGVDDNIRLKMPSNVLSFDNYFRRDGSYEGVLDRSGFAAFDGVNVVSGNNFNRELGDWAFQSSVCTPLEGGNHSGVHIWYRGTIETNAVSLSECISWYNPASIFVNPSVANESDNRQTLGFNRSRVGGLGYPSNGSERESLADMEASLIERTGYGLRPVFNGDFSYGDGQAGWTQNGGINSAIVNKVAVIGNDMLRHSYFFFASNNQGQNYSHLKFRAKSLAFVTLPAFRSIRVRFRNVLNEVYVYDGSVLIYQDNTWFNVFCPIPNAFQRTMATFEVQSLNGEVIVVNDFEFTNELPNGLVLSSSVLPVDLSHFTAQAKGSDNLVMWTTLSEKNMLHYLVEKSSNGKDSWVVLGKERAKGTSNQQHDYNFLDQQPFPITYYRLRSVDFDGKEDLSKIVSVSRSIPKTSIVNIYPVPATNILNVEYISKQSEKVSFEITDMLGRIIYTNAVNADEGNHTIGLPIEDLAAGMYILNLKTNYTVDNKIFVKK